MAKGALFVSWGQLIAGREQVGSGVLQKAMQLLGRYQQEGKIDSFEVFTLEPHRGDIQGFLIVKGEKAQLASLRVDDELVETIVGVQLVHEKVGVTWAYTGSEMGALFAMWGRQEQQLLGSE